MTQRYVINLSGVEMAIHLKESVRESVNLLGKVGRQQ